MSKRSRRKRIRRLALMKEGYDNGKYSGKQHETPASLATFDKTLGKEKHAAGEGGKKQFFLKRIYEKEYKKLIIIPLVILLLAIAQIAIQTATTEDFINKGVSLKGGVTIVVPSEQVFDLILIKDSLARQFPDLDINARLLKKTGDATGLVIEADAEKDRVEDFLAFIEQLTKIPRDKYSIEEMGSSLGATFFKQAFLAIIIAFVFMGIVVFIIFRTFVPSLTVILAALSDIIVTVAIVNLLGMKVSTAGVAAFLMIIGYSVDTNILLTTRMIKRTEGAIMERLYSAIKTGLTMSFTTIVAVIIGLTVAQSEVLRQIMTVILIGLIVDMMNTWIQNSGILRWYIEKRRKNE